MNRSKKFLHFAQWIRDFRARNNLTQKELADEIDLHSQFISNAERGLCRLPAEKMVRLIELFGNRKDKTQLKQAWIEDATQNAKEYVEEVFG